MIIRNNCFETNSSSTHAFCIGQGRHLKTPFELLNAYNSGKLGYEDYSVEYIALNEEDNDSQLLPYSDESLIKICKKAYEDSDDNKYTIILSRYSNLGRKYGEYRYFREKLNFFWTCLIYYYNYCDSDWFKTKERADINLKFSFKLFLEHLQRAGFKLYCSDIEFVKDEISKNNYNEPTELGYIFSEIEFPSKWRNKHMKGKETYGYYPIYEVCKIINDSTLFWNCMLGDSVIYTGSDETDTFENMDFSTYKIHMIGGSDSGVNCEYNRFKYNFPEIIGKYKNGNYETKLYSDGTRTRELTPYDQYYDNSGLYKFEKYGIDEIDLMNPEFPESIDLKITDLCNNNCSFCYANSSKDGKQGDKLFIKNIISQMHPYTEIALGGGNPLEYPYLIEILEYAKEKDIICNMTIKDKDAINNFDFINNLYQNNLIHSFGISPTSIETLKEFKKLKHFRFDFTLHLILGVHSLEFIHKVEDDYFDKILILGYKNIGKGNKYFQKYKKEIEKNIREISNYILSGNSKFMANIIAFDNLAIEQLNLEEYSNFDMYYQGKDGKFSFYIDAVKQTYARSSLEEGDTFGHRNLDLDYYFQTYIKED